VQDWDREDEGRDRTTCSEMGVEALTSGGDGCKTSLVRFSGASKIRYRETHLRVRGGIGEGRTARAFQLPALPATSDYICLDG
jgi:hypothetical protein